MMKTGKCVVCEKVKGKRICRLHSGASICSRCCVRIRHAECVGCSYYGNIGLCYGYLGRKQEALASLDKALALDPAYGPALLNRRIIMALAEGERLPEEAFASVDYYRDTLR